MGRIQRRLKIGGLGGERGKGGGGKEKREKKRGRKEGGEGERGRPSGENIGEVSARLEPRYVRSPKAGRRPMPAAGVVIYFVEVSSSSPIPALHPSRLSCGVHRGDVRCGICCIYHTPHLFNYILIQR